MINQCSDCGGFCKKSGCERENVKPTPQRIWIGLTDDEIYKIAFTLEGEHWKKIADAIESKLKDKNNNAKT